MRRILCLIALVVCGSPARPASLTIDGRPYEVVWAKRDADTHPPLIDFDSIEGWRVDARDAVATLERSAEPRIWGTAAVKLTYHAAGPSPLLTLVPPAPVPVRAPFDCANFWIYGNNWGWAPDASTPQVSVTLLFRARDGGEVRVGLGNVRWREWWVMHRRLAAVDAERLAEGAVLTGIEIGGATNKADRVIFLDNLALYREALAPLHFEPRPARGVAMFPGQGSGTNTGPGKLPFPTREETILPDNLAPRFRATLTRQGAGFLFRYQGTDGTLEYRYAPRSGTLGDVSAQWVGRGPAFRPMVDGGVCLAAPGEKSAVLPEKAELRECRQEGDTVVSRWSVTTGGVRAEVAYTFRLWQKSLVVDVKCLGGAAAEVRLGRAVGAEQPRLVNVPYLTFASSRPAVLVAGPTARPLFTSAWVDFYRSNASDLYAANAVDAQGATFNGGSHYYPKTDGRRNDCFERLFLTLSPRFEEVLPNLANPRSPWMSVAGERVWRAHGASNRAADYAGWAEIARYGMTKLVITDHEVGWRDDGESFTMRTRAAPLKGGDEGQVEYSRKMRALGFRYGLYTNYTDYAPVNEYWDEDYVSRQREGDWRPAWPRCYNIKPSRAVEMEAKLAPTIERKFGQDASYCDVHTAVSPWDYCDYDARVPGGGTFAATLYAYGEIMLNEKRVYQGPVYSEGRQHWYYCGLTDGNYGQDPSSRLAVSPWLVDFDLRKMHPLATNFGMGSPSMFYGKDQGLERTPAERDASLDRFLAATLAFGHTGFLVREGGIPNAARSYFMLQQVHKRYAEQRARSIRYADAAGRLLDSSAAVATGAFRRSQIVTLYDNGLLVAVNGNPDESWHFRDGAVAADLPPNGYLATFTGASAAPAKGGKKSDLYVVSGTRDGHRADYADTPEYLYADGRGTFTRFARAACDGPFVAHRRAGGVLEAIPIRADVEFGVSVGGGPATATALDKEGKGIGPAQTRLSRGLVYVQPVQGAFSYLLKPSASVVALACARDRVVPGETVVVKGKTAHPFQVPADAKPGTRLWQQFEGAWIDFTIVPLAETSLVLDGDLRLTLKSNLPGPAKSRVSLGGTARTVTLAPGVTSTLRFPFEAPAGEGVTPLAVRLALSDGRRGAGLPSPVAGLPSLSRTWYAKTERALRALVSLPARYRSGECARGGKEVGFTGESGGYVSEQASTCGGQTRKGLFMHPPYKNGVGYSFARFEGIALPAGTPAAFRCWIGKRDGSDTGDGILFRALVIDAAGKRTVAAEQQWVTHGWMALEADLSRWAGQTVALQFDSDVGPKDDSSGDWACWADLRLETATPMLTTTLSDEPVSLRHAPSPHPLPGVTAAELRAARRGWVRFRGIGLEGRDPYVSQAVLNGVSLGDLPGAGGDEVRGVWSEEQSLALPPAAIQALGFTNRLEIHNPAQDCFKVRDFRIDLELADGRLVSSQVDAAIVTQPAGWAYAEGLGVPFDEPIRIELPFGN